MELSLENRLLVQNHEQVEGDENEGRVRKYRGAVEEPRLAHEDCEDAVVHGISGVTIKTADDKVARRIDWCEGALASREEVPDAAEQDESAEKDQGGSRDRGSTDRRNTQLVGREEHSIRHVASDEAWQKCHEEQCSDREEELHGEDRHRLTSNGPHGMPENTLLVVRRFHRKCFGHPSLAANNDSEKSRRCRHRKSWQQIYTVNDGFGSICDRQRSGGSRPRAAVCWLRPIATVGVRCLDYLSSTRCFSDGPANVR